MENNTFNQQLPLWSFQFRSSSRMEVTSRKEIESKLITKALKDEAFKKELQENGKATVEQFCNIRFPETMEVRVVEETEDQIYLVLPHNPYAGIPEADIQNLLGMGLDEVAGWVLEQQQGISPDGIQHNIKLVAKAWREESFKRLLLTDPVLAIEQQTGEEIEASITLTVLEETPDAVFIVIPYMIENALADNEVDTSLINLPLIIGSGNTKNPNIPKDLDTKPFFSCGIPV